LDRVSGRCGYHALIAPQEVSETKIPQSAESGSDLVNPVATAPTSTSTVCTCVWSVPFLVALADGPFLQALSLFQCRLTYANLCGDVPVGFETAAIQFTNPLPHLAPDYVIDCPNDPTDNLPRIHQGAELSRSAEPPFYFRVSREISRRLTRTQETNEVPLSSIQGADESSDSSISDSGSPSSRSSSSPGGRTAPEPPKRPAADAKQTPRLGLSDTAVLESVCQIHTNLNTLSWRRVAVRGRPLLAHTDIVVKSETINAKGKQIVADLISKLDSELEGSQFSPSVRVHLPSDDAKS